MSYCRWSTDDFQSDVYVYESDWGFVIHVASARRVFNEPLPPQVDLHEDIDGWLKRHNKVTQMCETATMVPLELEGAGETYTYRDPREAATKLRELKAAGFYVPEGVPEELEAEGEPI